METQEILQEVHDWTKEKVREVVDGENIPSLAYNLEAWADQKAIATPDTYTDAVRTTGGDIPIETSAGSKLESIKPVAGSKWTAKMLFNGSYNMLNAAKWGDANSQPYVGGVGSNFVYFLVPELTLGTFGTADENNGLLFTNAQGENIQPTSVYFKSLGETVPQSKTDGTELVLQVQASAMGKHEVDYDGKKYYPYTTDGAGWLIIPDTYYDASGDNGVCAHIAWEDWYDKYVSLKDSETPDPEKVVGTLILEGLLNAIHPNTTDKYLRGVNDEVCDNVVFGDTSATISHMVDELSVAANAWTNSATGESDSQGNALYRHSATVSGIKQGGAACVESEDGGIPLTVNGTTVSYIDTNATVTDAQTVFYQIPTTEAVDKAYTDAVFSGSNIDTATGVLPINDCSIEAQVAMEGMANITVKYAKNIVDQVAINATIDVPQIKKQVEDHEVRVEELEDTAVRTNSYDASVAVGLADNLKGDTVVEEPFFKRKTAGTKSVGSGIAAIKEVRGKSIVWNQQIVNSSISGSMDKGTADYMIAFLSTNNYVFKGHKVFVKGRVKFDSTPSGKLFLQLDNKTILTRTGSDFLPDTFYEFSLLYTIDTDDWHEFRFYASTSLGEATKLTWENVNVIDLTLMFGAGNEPATVGEFEKMFPLDYYDYNEGEIIPFAGQNLTTIGFNMLKVKGRIKHVGEDLTPTSKRNFSEGEYWNGFAYNGYFSNAAKQTNVTLDEGQVSATSTNSSYGIGFPVKCEPNTQYYYKTSYGVISFFDKEGVNVGNYQQTMGVFTTPANAAWMVIIVGRTTGAYTESNLVVNISDTDRNGTYEPYEKHTLPLDPSQWRDKQTGNLVFPYGGMHGVGSVYDYAKVDADGYIRKAVRVFGQVDLGDLNWNLHDNSTFVAVIGDTLKLDPKGICSGYPVINTHWPPDNPNVQADDAVILTRYGGPWKGRIGVKDSSYTDTTTFKTAMNGVMLCYELAEPVEIELATPIYAKYLADKDGTEEITPTNGTTPYTTMANLSILYAMDARGEIKNLPKNYLSKESAENMLNAMVSAGVIASYTMTYDAANARYQFTIVAPTQSNE